jgi:hypothetical protein
MLFRLLRRNVTEKRLKVRHIGGKGSGALGKKIAASAASAWLLTHRVDIGWLKV